MGVMQYQDYTLSINDRPDRRLTDAQLVDDWHEAIDQAGLEAGRFLMTTWHDDEDEDDVAHFFVWNTFYEDQEFTRFLVLVLGTDPQQAEVLVTAVYRHVGGAAPA
jgi:hypothetical protein